MDDKTLVRYRALAYRVAREPGGFGACNAIVELTKEVKRLREAVEHRDLVIGDLQRLVLTSNHALACLKFEEI